MDMKLRSQSQQLLPKINMKSLGYNRYNQQQTDQDSDEKKTNSNEKQYHENKQIYTVSKSMQSQYIRKNIDINIGSLSHFLNYEDGLTQHQSQKNQLKKRKQIKEQENEEDNDDDRGGMFNKNKIKYQNPVDILKYEDDEKKRQKAAKDIVQQIFKRNFGEDADKFEENNTKEINKLKFHLNQGEPTDPENSPTIQKVMKKYQKKNLSEKLSIFENDYLNTKKQPDPKSVNLKQQKDQNQNTVAQHQQPQSPSKTTNNNNEIQIQYQADKKQKENFEKKIQQTIKNYTYEDRFNFILNIRVKYNDIQNLWSHYIGDKEEFQKENEEKIKQSISLKSKKLDIYEKKIQRFDYWEIRKRTIDYSDPEFEEFKKEFLDFNEFPKDEVFIYQNKQILIWNEEISPLLIFYTTLHFKQFDKLLRFELVNTKLKDDSVHLILENLATEALNIQKIDLSNNKLGQRSCQSLQKICKLTCLKNMNIRQTEITTKLFCIISLGIGQSLYIEEINISDNLLDSRSTKTIETLLRYIKNLKYIQIQNNPQISYASLKEIKKIFSDKNKTGKDIRIS